MPEHLPTPSKNHSTCVPVPGTISSSSTRRHGPHLAPVDPELRRLKSPHDAGCRPTRYVMVDHVGATLITNTIARTRGPGVSRRRTREVPCPTRSSKNSSAPAVWHASINSSRIKIQLRRRRVLLSGRRFVARKRPRAADDAARLTAFTRSKQPCRQDPQASLDRSRASQAGLTPTVSSPKTSSPSPSRRLDHARRQNATTSVRPQACVTHLSGVGL